MNVITAELPRAPGSVRMARRLVHGQTRALSDRQRADVALMVSELVTNALQHGVGTISLRVDTEADGLRIEVSDEGHVSLSPTPTPGAGGGWGLRIIEQLSDQWGVTEGSTRVWFRLRH